MSPTPRMRTGNNMESDKRLDAAITSKGWICVDLDRTLAEHLEGTGAPVPGRPIGPMVERVKRWMAQGYDVRIFTARVQDQRVGQYSTELGLWWTASNQEQRGLIRAWCRAHLGRELPITNCKDMHLWCLFDDRAVSVTPNVGTLSGYSLPSELADPPAPYVNDPNDWGGQGGPDYVPL